MKLQKEMSQKLDATRLNSQESIGALSGTMRRPFGSTLSRPAGTAGLTAPKWMDLSLRRPTLAPSRDPYSSHKDVRCKLQIQLSAATSDLNTERRDMYESAQIRVHTKVERLAQGIYQFITAVRGIPRKSLLWLASYQ